MKSECSIIDSDSDSDSCCSSNYEEEQNVEHDEEEVINGHKDRKDSDKGKEHNQPEVKLDTDGHNWNEELMDQDMPIIEDDVNSFKDECHHVKRIARRTETSVAEPHSFLRTDTLLADAGMQDDGLIATGQHHIWI